MLMLNHALTGILLALHIDEPWALFPAASASHFVLDAIPHFGHREGHLHSRRWYITGVIDGLVSFITVAISCVLWPQRVGHIVLGAVSAIWPDLLYVPEVLLRRPLTGWFGRWHQAIQWGENPTAWIVDVAWMIFMVYLLRQSL